MIIGFSCMAQQPVIYKLKFDKQKSADEMLNPIDTLQGVYVVPVANKIIGYSQNLFNADSTAIYEGGYFYDVLSENGELPQLDAYILDPYPTNPRHQWMGISAIYKRKNDE